MKESWKGIWPELSKDINSREPSVDVDEIELPANETVLRNTKAHHAEE